MNSKNYILLLSLLPCLQLFATDGLNETFESFDNNAALPRQGSSSGSWSQIVEIDGLADKTPEPGSAIVQSEAGRGSGRGLRLLKRYTYVTYESETPIWTIADGPMDFKIDFRVQGAFPFDLAIHNGRTSAGIYVNLNLNEKRLDVSDGGGVSVYRPSLAEHFLGDVTDDVWYTLEIRGLTHSPDGNGLVEGRLYLYETENPMNILLDGVAVMSAGSIPFSEIKMITLRRWGTDEALLDIDNMIIEPSAEH